jgi:hypothetical protein
MGEIVAAQSPFSGCIGDFRRLRQRAESGHYMGTRLIRAKTPNRDEAQTCISDQHSGHRYGADLSRAPPGFYEKARCFSRCKMSLVARLRHANRLRRRLFIGVDWSMPERVSLSRSMSIDILGRVRIKRHEEAHIYHVSSLLRIVTRRALCAM